MINGDGGFLLPLDAIRIGGREQPDLAGFGHVERIYEAEAVKRLICAHPLAVGVLDVEARDVVGQQLTSLANRRLW
jgi:hypothetical protein